MKANPFTNPTVVACVNVPAACQPNRLLREAGWRLVVKEPYLINQIWTASILTRPVGEIGFPDANFDLSDHLPVGAVIDLSSSS